MLSSPARSESFGVMNNLPRVGASSNAAIARNYVSAVALDELSRPHQPIVDGPRLKHPPESSDH